MREVDEVRWFVYRKLHYIWVEKEKKLTDVDDERDGHWVTPSDIISQVSSVLPSSRVCYSTLVVHILFRHTPHLRSLEPFWSNAAFSVAVARFS